MSEKKHRFPVDDCSVSATIPTDLLESLHDLAAATTRSDCVARIEAHLAELFGHLEARLVLEPQTLQASSVTATLMRGDPSRVCLEARGRHLGHVQLGEHGPQSESGRRLLEAFAEHAALALDNAQMLEEHEQRARRDPLTGLLNRGEFQERLAAAVAAVNARPAELLSLAVFDLDRFKDVNDAGGHGAGDRLLRAVAAALSAVCRSSDAAFRIGGDEFALLLTGCGAGDAAAIATRATDAIARLEGSAGASWGVATIPADATTREELLAVADAGVYARKGRRKQAKTPRPRDTRGRLEVASHLATRLTKLHEPGEIAQAVVDEFHSAFGYYLATIHRLDTDGMLRIVAQALRELTQGAGSQFDPGVVSAFIRTVEA
jgi:diguanylate cyclase (GGDEF)-like protein